MTFGVITQEDREKAKASRLAKKQWAENNLKLDYEDENVWADLARKYDVRLPAYSANNTEVKHLKRAMVKLGIDPKDYFEACGVSSMRELVKLNPKWNARAEVCLLLEYWNEIVGSKEDSL